MFRALIRKKLMEFRKGSGVALLLLAAFSLAPLFRLGFDTPVATFVPLLLFGLFGWFMGPAFAAGAFQGDFANQANRFLEYLPLKRSAIWLTDYLSGLALLCLTAIGLLWAEVLLFPLKIEAAAAGHGSVPGPDLFYVTYLIPGRWGMLVTWLSIQFWMFSVGTFPAAYLDRKDSPVPIGAGAGMSLIALVMPIFVIFVLSVVNILPSGPALSPVLLASGLLYAAGSYALFALTPKHMTRAKRGLLGAALFLVISAVLVGQLYVKHLEWRVLDPSLPLRIEQVNVPVQSDPSLLLAEVRSCRSGRHHVSIRVADGAYHDLGRGLHFLDVPDGDNGLLHFGYTSDSRGRSGWQRFVTMTPEATATRSFEIPGGRIVTRGVRWLPGKGLLVYAAYFEEDRRHYRCDLCVADSEGTLLRRVPIRGGDDFFANAAGRAVAIAPTARADDASAERPTTNEEKSYLSVDLDGDSVLRFGLPGNAVCFAKDLKRVVCSRIRIRDGRRYTSYFLVELPSMAERPILSEDDLPADQVTSQVGLDAPPSVATNDANPIAFLRFNEAFDAALWLKQRVDGDYFRYSIVLIELNTGQRQVVVPESATLPMPVVVAKGGGGYPTTLDRFTADQSGFLYSIGPRVYLCEIKNRQSVLLADHSIRVDGAEEEMQQRPPVGQPTYGTVYSPSGRRVLRFANVWQKPSPERLAGRLKFAAIEVFQDGKPVQVHTGQRFIRGARWADDQRIVFHEDAALYLLESAGGPLQPIFPPAEKAAYR